MIKPTILIADNDSDYCRSLESLLALDDFIVKLATSVNEANALIDDFPLDLILADLRLTNDGDDFDFSGLEVARRALAQQIPCIMITAFPSVEGTRLALRSQGVEPPLAVDFIPKASGPAAVLDAIKKAPFFEHFALLHISDLHFRTTRENKLFDQNRSLRAIKEDLKELRNGRKIGRIKAIIISGDIGFKGREDSYDTAWLFLQDICTSLRVTLNDVILVPGNHDLDRIEARTEFNTLPSNSNKDSVLFSKFNDFLDFTTRFYSSPEFTPDKLFKLFDFGRIAVIALNSCYRDGNPLYRQRVWRNEYYPGWIDEKQISQAINEMNAFFSGRKVLRLAVCHHLVLPEGVVPKRRESCLSNYHELLKYTLAEAKIRILFHGHGHETQLLQPPVPGTGMPYTFGAGTLLIPKDKKDSYKNQYLIADFGSTARIFMRKYVYSEGDRLGAWTDDDESIVGGTLELSDIALPT